MIIHFFVLLVLPKYVIVNKLTILRMINIILAMFILMYENLIIEKIFSLEHWHCVLLFFLCFLNNK